MLEKILYKSNFNISQALIKIKNEIQITDEIKSIINFVENSERGLI